MSYSGFFKNALLQKTFLKNLYRQLHLNEGNELTDHHRALSGSAV